MDVQVFIDQCIANGKVTPTDWCEAATEKVNELSKEISRIDELKKTQAQYRSLIIQLGGEEKLVKRDKFVGSFVEPLDLELVAVCSKIYNFVKNSSASLTPRDIADGVGGDTKLTMLGIKYFWDKGIIVRNEQSVTREVVKGPNWEARAVEFGEL